jgi:hypothetical protein
VSTAIFPDVERDLIGELGDYLVAPQAYRPDRPRVRPKNHVPLPCGNCGLRIAWWTEEIRPVPLGLQDASHRGWKWQGQGACPVSFRDELVDVSCPDCGWSREGVARQSQPWLQNVPEIIL